MLDKKAQADIEKTRAEAEKQIADAAKLAKETKLMTKKTVNPNTDVETEAKNKNTSYNNDKK